MITFELIQTWMNNEFLFILIVCIFTVFLGTFINRLMIKAYHRAELLHQKRKNEQGVIMHSFNITRFTALRRILVGLVYFGGILLIISSIPSLRSLSYSMFAGAGILAIIIGFATQEVLANIVAGMFVSIFEPFRIGDRIYIEGTLGYVEDITLWHTVIRTFNNERLMIPNAIVAKEKIRNDSIGDDKIMNYIEFSISYDSDIDLARKIISEEIENNPYFLHISHEHHLLRGDDTYAVRVIEHGDFFIKLRAYAWSNSAKEGFFLKTSLLESVKKRFDKEGVEIPFPYRTIVEKKNIPKPKRLKKIVKKKLTKKGKKKK